MTRTPIMPVLAGAILLGLISAATAATGDFENMCAEGLALGKVVPTDCLVNVAIDGKTYCFGNETVEMIFMKDAAGNLAKAQSYYSSKQ